MSLFLISLLAGVLTVLAPCILPLLPVIVGGSITDGPANKKKALVITLSLGISVVLFTFLLKISTVFINVSPTFWQFVSGVIIIVLGFATLFPKLWDMIPFMGKLNRSSNAVMSSGYQKQSFWGDVLVGASLGPVFTTCSPTYFIVLATVLPVSFTAGLIDILAYAFGLSVSLFCIALIGQRLVGKLNNASNPHGWFKKALGVLFLIVGVAIITGFDKKIQVYLLDGRVFDVTRIEQKLLQNNAPSTTLLPENSQQDVDIQSSEREGGTSGAAVLTEKKQEFLTQNQKQKQFILAPDLSTIDGYVNTDGKAITIADYKGKKVVLLDIWTYSCINCQRTIPYINGWYTKYEDEGLVIIGLHTPEFAFEKVQKNVENAVEKFKIKYPVVLDNDYSTWRAYGNQFWPRKYLIDIDGYIVYDHIGEGSYDETELAIQKALKELNDRLGEKVSVSGGVIKPENITIADPSKIGSRESYFGSARNEFLGNGKSMTSGIQTLILPNTINPNTLYLDGTWNFSSEFAEAKSESNIVIKYKAKDVYLVASSIAGSDFEVFKDGILVTRETGAGSDVDPTTGKGTIKEDRLYKIIEDNDYGIHTLRIHIKNGGLQAFAFTFG